MKTLTLILGNQLFDLDHFNSLPQERFFMAEDTAKKKKIYQAADLFREKMTTKAP